MTDAPDAPDAPDAAHDAFELSFWGNCCNTHWEETKHFVYAARMGLPCYAPPSFAAFCFDCRGASVLDIGGGPTSMLLKARNFARAAVVDPLKYPEWVYARYACHGVKAYAIRGEDLQGEHVAWDEAWVYNCLQHTDDPARIIANARKIARTIRLFEWVDIPPHEGHPQMITAPLLRSWLGVGPNEGKVEELNESGCVGRAFSGVFGDTPKGVAKGSYGAQGPL